ncbi:hypothetical protein M413DRAFT_440073, partial [Hebeloma cylindrosporum]
MNLPALHNQLLSCGPLDQEPELQYWRLEYEIHGYVCLQPSRPRFGDCFANHPFNNATQKENSS